MAASDEFGSHNVKSLAAVDPSKQHLVDQMKENIIRSNHNLGKEQARNVRFP